MAKYMEQNVKDNIIHACHLQYLCLTYMSVIETFTHSLCHNLDMFQKHSNNEHTHTHIHIHNIKVKLLGQCCFYFVNDSESGNWYSRFNHVLKIS